MAIKRGYFAIMVVAGTAAALLAGCAGQSGQDGAGDTGDTADGFDAMAAVAASTRKLSAGNFAFTFTAPRARGDVAGVVHAPSRSAAMTYRIVQDGKTMKWEVRALAADWWVRITATELVSEEVRDRIEEIPDAWVRDLVEVVSGKQWFSIDPGKVKKGGALDLDTAEPDLTGVSDLLAGAVTADGDSGRIIGMLDAGKVGEGLMMDAETVKAMGDEAKTLPFTALLDRSGQLTELDLVAPAAGTRAPAGEYVIKFTGYGAQRAAVKPGGRIEKMPASVYSILS